MGKKLKECFKEMESLERVGVYKYWVFSFFFYGVVISTRIVAAATCKVGEIFQY